MDSRKPLTAGEDSEVVRSRMVCCDNDCEHLKIEEHGYTRFCEKYGNVSLDRTVAGYEEVEYEAFRCSACLLSSLSLLTPPPDAAVREAASRLDRSLGYGRYAHVTAEDINTLLSYVRAVQAPRLAGEQVEAAFREGYELGNDDGRNIDVFCHIKTHSPVSDADFAWEYSESRRAAFPDAFAGEVGNE